MPLRLREYQLVDFVEIGYGCEVSRFERQLKIYSSMTLFPHDIPIDTLTVKLVLFGRVFSSESTKIWLVYLMEW